MHRWAFLLLVCGCATTHSVVDRPSTVPTHVVVEPAVVQFLQLQHYRLFGHSKYRDTEWAWCLQGRVSNDTVFVNDIAVVKIVRASELFVDTEKWCDQPDYVGMVHNHVPTVAQALYGMDGCWFSYYDLSSLQRDPKGIVHLVTCGEGRIIYRFKNAENVKKELASFGDTTWASNWWVRREGDF